MVQTYHYMIETGLEYGLLTTGQAIVFLKIDWAEPATLYYQLAEPGPEASTHPNNLSVCSAVGQYLAFTLLALGTPGGRPQHTQEERKESLAVLETWTVDFNTTYCSVPEPAKSAPDSSAGFNPKNYKAVDRSPYPLRLTKARRAASCQDTEVARSGHAPRDSSDDEPAPRPLDTPTPRLAGRGASTGQGATEQQPAGGDDDSGQRYCTQKCLLGLVNGDFLDSECPNMALHCKGGAHAGKRHPVNHKQWLCLLREQLVRSLDDGITPLGLGGARGVLFRVTLLAHGYAVVSKGTVRAFIKFLEHEAAIYQHLKPLQGIYVPVFLGAIDLRNIDKVYYYDHRVYVVHLSFLSWGGGPVDPAPDASDQPLREAAMRTLRAIHQRSVVHKDARLPNMLSNSETNGVMMIGFERASMLRSPRHPLAQLVPNKRNREPGEANGKSSDKQSSSARMFAQEESEVQFAFHERRDCC